MCSLSVRLLDEEKGVLELRADGGSLVVGVEVPSDLGELTFELLGALPVYTGSFSDDRSESDWGAFRSTKIILFQ